MNTKFELKKYSLYFSLFFYTSYYYHDFRDMVLILVSAYMFIKDSNTMKRIMLTCSIIHSVIHRVWPFLSFYDDQGYREDITTKYDIFWHFVLALIAVYYSAGRFKDK